MGAFFFWNGLYQYIDSRENAMPATLYSVRHVIDMLTIELLVTDLTFIYYRRLRPSNNRFRHASQLPERRLPQGSRRDAFHWTVCNTALEATPRRQQTARHPFIFNRLSSQRR